MRKIDIEKLIETYKLDERKISLLLYPTNKFPEQALKRQIKGESLLDEIQISRLSHFLGISVDKLFTGIDWTYENEGEKINFEAMLGGYTAELNTRTWITKVFKRDSLIHESVIHNGMVTLSDYIKMLNKIIKNNKENEYY